MAFNFNPEDGLLNTDEFPDKPASGTVARNQFMRLFNQIKEYINGMETNGVKANGGNADTVDGKHANEFATSGHTHNYLPNGSWDVSNQDLLVHGKRALVGMPNGSLYLGYGGDFTDIRCRNDDVIWHSGNFNPDTKSNSNHTHSSIANADNANKIKNKNIFVQQGQPTAQATGDVWISW